MPRREGEPERADGIYDEDLKPTRPLTDYERGFLVGLQTFAWNGGEGMLLVGTTGTTLRQATRRFLDEVGA